METKTSNLRFIFEDKEYGVKEYQVHVSNSPDKVDRMHVHISLLQRPPFSILNRMFDENQSGKILHYKDTGEVREEVEFKKVSKAEYAFNLEADAEELIAIDIFARYLKIKGVELDRTAIKDN